jgi:hypothetical protein
VILLVIIFLFRPSNNNQRYAFVPLLDPSDDEENDDDEEQQQHGETLNMRRSNKPDRESVEDALAWVEDNLPTSIADQALQTFDDEGDMAEKTFERSKMQ